MTILQVFDVVREKCPGSLEKVKGIEGDITKPGLGISDEDRGILKENLHVVFHCAASIR